MNNFDWAKLGIKLMGLWAIISFFRSSTNVIEAIYLNRSSMPLPFAIGVSALNPLAAGLIGLYLWICSDQLASSIFPRVSAAQNSHLKDQERLLPLALSLMGIWLVSAAIPALAYNISFTILSLTPARESVIGPIYQSTGMIVKVKADAIAALASGFIGFGLVLGSKRLAGIIRR